VITIGKDDALFCSDNCQQWLHRYRAGVSIKCYKDSKDNDALSSASVATKARANEK